MSTKSIQENGLVLGVSVPWPFLNDAHIFYISHIPRFFYVPDLERAVTFQNLERSFLLLTPRLKKSREKANGQKIVKTTRKIAREKKVDTRSPIWNVAYPKLTIANQKCERSWNVTIWGG